MSYIRTTFNACIAPLQCPPRAIGEVYWVGVGVGGASNHIKAFGPALFPHLSVLKAYWANIPYV